MRFSILISAALSLGLTAFIPTAAKADDYNHCDRHGRGHVRVVEVRHQDEWRHENWHRDNDFVDEIGMREVPDRVQDRVNDYRHGRAIEYVQLVHHDGDTFYRFRIDDRREGDFYLHIAPSGHLITRVNVGR